MTKPSQREAVAVVAAVACCTIAIAYAAIRCLQAIFYPSPDPRTVTHVTRIAFFWRAQLALYVGFIAALGSASLRGRDPARFDRHLPTLAVATGLIVLVQTVFAP